MASQYEYHIIGDAFLDTVCCGLGSGRIEWGQDLVTSQPVEDLPGGSALNTAVHLADAVGRQVDQDARQVVGFLLEVVAAFGAGVLAEPRRARLESVARVRLRHLYSRRSEASEELRCAR